MILYSAPWAPLAVALLAAGAYMSRALVAPQPGSRLKSALAVVAWLLHGVVLGLQWWGPHPGFGFAPALSMTAWIAFAVYSVESRWLPSIPLHRLFAWGCVAALALAQLWPGRSLMVTESPWLPIHWACGLASYGLFAVAVAHAAHMSRSEGAVRQAEASAQPVPLLTLERLTFRFVEVGFALLTLSIAVAVIGAEHLYPTGKLFKVDHKTVFAVLSWATFAVLVLGRRQLGWRGKRAIRMLYLGATLLLLSYAGTRFVLEVVLQRTP